MLYLSSMWKRESEVLLKDRSVQLATGLLVGLVLWWVVLQLMYSGDTGIMPKMIWGASYQIMSLLGGIWGMKIAFDWGGEKSVVGRLLIAFAAGLLLQTFGQSIFSYYNLFSAIAIPYPSLADIGYFGSIVFYIYGVAMLAQVSGAHLSFRSLKTIAIAIAVPTIMIGLAYVYFLQGYDFVEAPLSQVILDFGYPIGQSIYVSVAMLAYLLTTSSLGGAMKHRVLFILVAMAIQYLADFNFLYQAVHESWSVSGYGDLIYLFAYFFLTIGLIQMKTEYVLSSEQQPS